MIFLYSIFWLWFSRPQFLQDPLHLPTHPNLHPFFLSFLLENKQASKINNNTLIKVKTTKPESYKSNGKKPKKKYKKHI